MPKALTAILFALFLLMTLQHNCFGKQRKTRRRGFTVTNLNDKTLKDISIEWNGNIVRYMIRPDFLARHIWRCSCNDAWERVVRELPEGLDNAQKYGITVVLDLHGLPNENHKDYPTDRDQRSAAFWNDADNLRIMIKCWQDMAKISANRKQDIWFDIYNEPLDWNDMPNFPVQWPDWAQKTIDAIRKIDNVHPVVVQPGPGGLCGGFKNFPRLRDKNIIYSLHQYWPHKYTHQGIGSTNNTDLAQLYENNKLEWPNKKHKWDKKLLDSFIKNVVTFQKKYKVRIFVGEFSAVRWAPGAENYLKDSMELFEKYGWDWVYHSWEESPAWSLEHDDSFENATISKTPVKRKLIVKKFMQRNQSTR